MLRWLPGVLVIVAVTNCGSDIEAAVGMGKAWNKKSVTEAMAQLDNFVRILENEGVKVRRPDALDHSIGYKVEITAAQPCLFC
jgi:hypothetical protein